MPHAETHLHVRLLGKTFGCEVSGIDWSKPIPEDAFDELKQIINEYGVVMVRKKNLNDHTT